MAENRRGKENRYYFSRGQMVLLGGVFVLASVVIFFLGMVIGKSLEERKIASKEEPLVRIPVNPGGAKSGPTVSKPDEVTFNDGESKVSNTAAVADKSPSDKVPAKVTKAEAPAPKAEKKPEKVTVEAAPKQQEAVTRSEAAESSRVWRAQVNAFPDERSAKLLVDRLKNKGYNAYVSEVQNRGRTWFRVSVGRYDSRDEAEKTVETLKAKENFSRAFAASK